MIFLNDTSQMKFDLIAGSLMRLAQKETYPDMGYSPDWPDSSSMDNRGQTKGLSWDPGPTGISIVNL
jgi:hypothetical protein